MSHVYLKLSVEDGRTWGYRAFGPLGAVRGGSGPDWVQLAIRGEKPLGC